MIEKICEAEKGVTILANVTILRNVTILGSGGFPIEGIDYTVYSIPYRL